MTTGDQPAADPAHVAALIEQLQRQTDQQFAEALADCVMDPDVDEQAAFRSEELAYRSLVATRYLIDNVNTTIRRRADESNKSWITRAEHFRNRVGMERRLLQAIVDGHRAAHGIIPNAPNPRARAMRELARRHPEEFLEIVRAEQEAVRDRARARKEERKRAKREARAQRDE